MKKQLFPLFLLFLSASAFGQSTAGPFVISSGSSACASIDVSGQSAVGISVTGTFSATLQPEVTIQGQAATNIQVTPSTSSTAQATITAAGNYTASVGGYSTFLMCITAYTSGTATIRLNTVKTTASNGGTGSGGSTYTPPVTTTGDLFGFSTVPARVPVGADATVLTADSTQPLGLKWAAPGASSLPVTGTTVTIIDNGGGEAYADSFPAGGNGKFGTGLFIADVGFTSAGQGALATPAWKMGQSGWYLHPTINQDWIFGNTNTVLDVFAVKGDASGTSIGTVLPAINCYSWSSGADLHTAANMAIDTTICRNGATGKVQVGTAGAANGEVDTGTVNSALYATATDCSAVGTAANPSVVSCGSAASGTVYCDVAASAGTCVINTTAAGTNSNIIITPTSAANTRLGKTCNAAPSVSPAIPVAAQSNGVSVTLNMHTVAVNGMCYGFWIVNK